MLTATRDQARATPSAPWRIVRIGLGITPESLCAFAPALRKKLRNDDGTFARDQIRAVAQRVQVVVGKKSASAGSGGELLRILTAASGVQAAVLGVRAFEPKWRALQDETENSYVIVCAI